MRWFLLTTTPPLSLWKFYLLFLALKQYGLLFEEYTRTHLGKQQFAHSTNVGGTVTHTQPRHTRVHVLHTAETCKLFQIFNPSGIVLYANIFFFFYSAHVNSNLCTLDLMWRQHNHPHSLSALRLIIYAYSDRLVPEGSGVSPTTTQARSERNVGRKSSASLAKLWHIYYYVRANN